MALVVCTKISKNRVFKNRIAVFYLGLCNRYHSGITGIKSTGYIGIGVANGPVLFYAYSLPHI